MATDKPGSGTNTPADQKSESKSTAAARAAAASGIDDDLDADARAIAARAAVQARADEGPTADAVVAAGRTVRHGEGQTKKKYVAGDTVTLPVDEIERLRALGYLKPAEEPEPKPGTRTDAGVSVTGTEPGTTTTVKKGGTP